MANLHDDNFDAKHFKKVEYNVRKIENMYNNLLDEIMRDFSLGMIDKTKMFKFSDYPSLKKKVDKLMEQFTKNLTAALFTQVEDSWKNGEEKLNRLAKKVGDRLGTPPEIMKEYLQPNKAALKKFRERVDEGMDLSKRVWNLNKEYKANLELALDVGISTGTSAQKMMYVVNQYLNEPQLIYGHEVNSRGMRAMTKIPANYNPGRGIYRSPLKNAYRLTRTENNIAYHQATFEKYQQFDFVRGYLVKLSNNPKHCPLCEAMAGEYPKDLKFFGWHPQCRCTTVPLLKTWEEMERDNDLIWQGKEPGPAANEVTEIPQKFQDWIINNREQIHRAKNKPYFIKFNMDIVGSLL
nr:hypothetical protein [uncultured Chryseobacterium sp.]